MAKRIPFSVIFATDEEPEYPSSELNSHGPAVVGWRCRPNSTLSPKEIILRFEKPAVICRIQVLAHQCMIPERIELYVHHSTRGAPTTPSSQTYDFLGFIALSDNSATNFKSRELQSVPVGPKKGTHLKLRFGSPYPNELNKSNQVALIAINVFGEYLSTDNAMQLIQSMNNERTETALASICDDLSFSMYVEETIVETIRELEQKKIKAVNDERFEYARKLKLCMGALRSAGERLGRYSLAKRQAVQQEDFIAAKLRKEQMELYKKMVFEQLQVNVLKEADGGNPDNDCVSDLYTQKPPLPSPPSLQDVASTLSNDAMFTPVAAPYASPQMVRRENSDIKSPNTLNEHRQSPIIGASPKRGSPNTGSLRRRNKSAPRSTFEDYEERAIPALRQECQGAMVLENDPCRGRSRLNERERRQAALPILVFGNEMVELFYSRQFQDREEGLLRLTSILKGEASDYSIGVNKISRSATLLLHRAVRDAVFSVFNHAAQTVRALFMDFVPNRVTPNEVSRNVDRLLPELLAKSGDPSPRIHTLAQHTILCIATCPEVRQQHLVAPALSRPVGSGTHPRLALSRMQMLEQLVLSQGISSDKQSGLTCRLLSESGCSGIHHPAEPVRKVAERVLLLVYKVNPRLVRKLLPPDDDITRRNLLYRQLFTEFDKIDDGRRREMISHQGFTQSGILRHATPPHSPNISNLSTSQHDGDGDNRKFSFNNGTNTNSAESTTVNSPRKTASYNHSPTNKSASASDSNEPDPQTHNSSKSSSESENRCPFCDWPYNDAEQLDKHYWKACPILTKCPQCSQVLEVAAICTHLTEECDAKIGYVRCDRCTEAVHKNLLDIHKLEDYCVEPKPNNMKCPLCHEEVEGPSNGGWKHHLVGCAGTARRRSRI
ncbi:centrosomal protein of 104 kDa isoform X2 [Sitodiplosis mosellana]|uniref:centrosomal protein of 104 kDa isoform X2 n=1 Tax=Sitodiplosis mosellana TaxID=263140 RepID=UPI0024441C55|nr:centrosomal protein of 104 kDa isoform X2 [Sitodiplosis mosellana]